MAFSPQFSGEFAPLFHLLDDYDVHRTCRPKKTVTPVRSFSPRFDVYEVEDGYQLTGELPGIDQSNIGIEFTDPHTLVIKGHAERNYAPIAAGINEQAAQTTDSDSSTKSRQPTVEDENESDDTASAGSSVDSSNQVATQQHKQPEPAYRYLASERSIGEFHRTFTFPTRVDQDAVKASLRDGILSVKVPKEPTPKIKKIRIE